MRRFLSEIRENFLAEQTRWIALVPVLFGVGIGFYFQLGFEPSWWISLGVVELLLLAFYFLRFKVAYHLPLLGLMLIVLGFINAQMHTIYQSRRVQIHDKTNTYIVGRINNINISAKGKVRLLLAPAADFDNPLKGAYRITTMNRQTDLKIGDCVETAATIFPPSPPAIKNAFQLDRKYFFDGLSAVGYTLSEVFKIECPQNLQSHDFSDKINTFRWYTALRINKALPIDEAGVIDALLVGERSYIPLQIVDDYRNSGLAHFLAVSGLHLGTIAGLIFFVTRWLVSLFPYLALRFESKKIAAVSAILFSFLYLLISGSAIPAQRAFIMTSVVLFGVMFNRQAISLRMVSFAALMVLIISPAALVSVSFQMSFAAVTALVVFYEKYATRIANWSYNRGFITTAFYYLLGIVICDFVASLATAPFAIYHFHKIALYTSLGNLLAGPLIAFWLMPAILVCLAVLPFSLLIYPLKVLALGIGILNKITAYVAALPHSVLYVHSLEFSGFMLIVCGAIWLCIWQRKWRWFGAIAIVLGCLTMFEKKAPDAVISYNAEAMALRDESGNMIPVSRGRIDSWTKQLWQENLNLTTLTKEQKKRLKNILQKGKKYPEWLDFQCFDNGDCLYKDALKFTASGEVFLKGERLDINRGIYIYFSGENQSFEYLSNPKICRPWQNCK